MTYTLQGLWREYDYFKQKVGEGDKISKIKLEKKG